MKDESAFDEDQLHALVDGRLPPEQAAQLREQVAARPELQQRLHAWEAQREQLRALHREVLQQAAPPPLAQAARQVGQVSAQIDHWQRWAGVAAGTALAFVLGWLAHGQWGGSSQALAGARPVNEFGRQALVAHVVFSPEVRHPVEVPAAQQEHLVQWLSKRLAHPLKVPDLAAQGYELVGGRLLSGDQGARAQFMFQNARGERLTLYVGALDLPRSGPAAATTETAFRFTSEGGASTFYWVDQGFGYALAGRLGRAELQQLADAVYRQL